MLENFIPLLLLELPVMISLLEHENTEVERYTHKIRNFGYSLEKQNSSSPLIRG